MKKLEETVGRMKRCGSFFESQKDIDQVVKVHEKHKMADLVARMTPLFTVKA